MAKTFNLPRFVKLAKYADFNIEKADPNTLYFIAEQGVIYQGSNLVTKSVQTDDSQIPGLFYIKSDGNLVTYDATGAETVVALSPANVEGLISAAKDEINDVIGDLTAADVAFDNTKTSVAKGEDVQAVIESIDTKLAAIAGGEDGDSLASLGLRISGLEDLTDGYEGKSSIKAAVDAVAKDLSDNYSTTEEVEGLISAAKDEINGAISGEGGLTGRVGALEDRMDTAEGEIDDLQAAIAAMNSEKDATGTAVNGGVFVVSGVTQVDGVITAVDSVEVEQAGAAAAVDAKLGAGFSATSTVKSYVDTQISTQLASVLKFKGVVPNKTALDAITGMVEGDVYYVTAESKEFVYVDEDDKKGWEELGATVDYSVFLYADADLEDGQILVASVEDGKKSAKTTGYKAGGEAFEETPVATTLATEKAVADIFAQLEWQTEM